MRAIKRPCRMEILRVKSQIESFHARIRGMGCLDRLERREAFCLLGDLEDKLGNLLDEQDEFIFRFGDVNFVTMENEYQMHYPESYLAR